MSRTTDFDKDEILTKAMHAFWLKGYEATSLKDLAQETGLLKGSLYNTFKSKENLFLLCLEKYGENSRSKFYTGGDPLIYLKSFFKRLVEEGSNKENYKGCFIMNSCLEFTNTQSPPALKSQKLFKATEQNLENLAKELAKNNEYNATEIKVNLTVAAFSLREISKFKKDRDFLKQIANNALKEFNISI